jgi:thioesterase domain-containing protein
MAIAFEQDAAQKVSPPLLLRAGNMAPTLFITPGLGGDIMGLSTFVNLIRTRQAIYGIQARGQRVEDIAQHYLAAITGIQPRGPYVLVGFSFGGLPMLEVARRLLERDEKIALLAFLETYPHSRYWSLRSWIDVLARRAKHHALVLTQMPMRKAVPRIGQLLAGLLEHLRIRCGKFPRKLSPTVDRQSGCESLMVAWAEFRPSYYPGKITFLQGEIATSYPDALSAWGNLAKELEIHKVPGDHVGIVTSHAERAANEFSRCLEKALLQA